jgi:uncharacterized protein (DUF2235 family)
MPPPKQTASAKPADLRVSVVPCNPDWKNASNGRHHIFLFDGTWNDETGINPSDFTWDNARHLWVSRADPAKAFAPIVTNVAKTHAALAPDGPGQVTHYFRGVGNDDDYDRANTIAEGAFARYEPFIRAAAYCEFLRNYRDGDQVSILGFSRGAATARLFARDLATLGFLDSLMIESRYAHVANTGELRQEIWTTWPRKSKRLVAGKDIPIAFLGAWDTVATNMSADDEDWEVPASVNRAVHCLALDETRVLFKPTLLSYAAGRAEAMKEVWFAGVHSDVGGGYFCDALGRLALDFMWRNWNNALVREGLAELAWQPSLAATLTDITGLPWLRHSEVRADQKFLVAPRACAPLAGGKPRVHRSVERFVQEGGLQFCTEDNASFPPRCQIASAVYAPVAYPGAGAVELYDSTAWA